MNIGIPKEIKTDEYRVSMTPEGVKELTAFGHSVYVQTHAGMGSGFSDEMYRDAGAIVVSSAQEVYETSKLIVKVKEPISSEYALFQKGQTLFTYLHLAADATLTRFLLEKHITAFAYETLQVQGRLPLLEPMSEVAGKMAALMGAVHLGRYAGGAGLLAGGAVGTQRAKVMVLGGGTAGANAAMVAAGLGADVTIFDVNLARLHELHAIMPANVATMYSTHQTIIAQLSSADIVIGTVLVAGAKAPKLITKEMLGLMKKGAVLVDVSIDQGGCFESSRPTTHTDPTFIYEDVVHYCVANMPGAYPITSTYALTNATLPFVKLLAHSTTQEIPTKHPQMLSALQTYEGKLYCQAVGIAHNLPSFTF